MWSGTNVPTIYLGDSPGEVSSNRTFENSPLPGARFCVFHACRSQPLTYAPTLCAPLPQIRPKICACFSEIFKGKFQLQY